LGIVKMEAKNFRNKAPLKIKFGISLGLGNWKPLMLVWKPTPNSDKKEVKLEAFPNP